MSPTTVDCHSTLSQYVPVSDTINRHDYGVQKHRKSASTGGGRAWSEDEEVYLLQTRLQKMPYKHIAAHLKKTELACRLHYHQLSHGSNRRKRTASVSSTGSTVHSPMMGNTSLSSMPSPIHEHSSPASPSSYTISPVMPHTQLPPASTLLSQVGHPSQHGHNNGSHPVTILPKPTQPRRPLSDALLKLDCDFPSANSNSANIDKARLGRIYEAHRAAFWGVIAAEYGEGVNALAMEQAFRNNFTLAPPTPCVSPDSGYHEEKHAYTEVKETKAISVSALLGIDANPTSPKERELIRMIEARRESIGN